MKSLRNFVRRTLGPRTRARIRSAIGRGSFDEIEILQEVLLARASNGVMIDVGACYGGSLEWFASRGWTVHAFEPDPKNRAVLRTVVARYPKVIVDSRAVSDSCREDLAFFSSEISAGISGLSSFHSSHQETARVDSVTIDRYVKDKSLSSIDLLKIDTEGFDMSVLRGVPWEHLRPSVIVCEFEDRKTVPLGYDFKALGNFLVDKGYQVLLSEWYPVKEYGTRHEWRRVSGFPCELVDANAWGNFIAAEDVEVIDQFVELAHRSSSTLRK